jgi:hypothetical protein
MPKNTLILAGTRKGLFIAQSRDRRNWHMSGPFLKGKDINHAAYDGRNGKIYATSNDAWFGSEFVWSDDLGKKWHSAKTNPSFDSKSGYKLERLWHIEPGPESEPKVVYLGVAPAALFKSNDLGKNWKEVTSLTKHSTRPRWHPGAGGLCLHSITFDPSNPKRFFVGISAVGVFRTEDGGKNWVTANRGTRAEFMPVKYPEFGQCVHKLLAAPSSPLLLFQQNHCGMYRSADAGVAWQEISKGLPSDFGFPLAIHPRKPEFIYVIPLQGAEFRCPPQGKLAVYRSVNGGKTWKALARGLPQKRAFCSVYREGMSMDQGNPAGVYFGTNTGKIFASRNEGDSWFLLADNLPPVVSVSAYSI